ncbi:MAG: hypothetical protein ACK4ND_03820 [Cytophagaceae bacterium]
MKKINTKYLETAFIQTIEGIFNLENNLKNYEPFIKSFKEQVFDLNEADKEQFLKEFKEALLITYNNPEEVNLGDLFIEATDANLNEPGDLLTLIKLFWKFFYGDEDIEKDEYKNLKFIITSEETPF